MLIDLSYVFISLFLQMYMFFLVLFNYLLFFLDRFLLKRFLGLILFLEKTKLLDFISLLPDLNINAIRYVELFLDLVWNDLWLNLTTSLLCNNTSVLQNTFTIFFYLLFI